MTSAEKAAAIDLHFNGRLTGRCSVPTKTWERCQKDLVAYAMKAKSG